jgi:GDP-L-fucose synthase
MGTLYMNLTEKRIVVTGGAGFLGQEVCLALKALGCNNLFIPRSSDYDLVQGDRVTALYHDAKPDVVIHLAAVVGGIGANRENPGKFLYDNLMMGVQLIHQALGEKVEKIVTVGTVCAYPKFAPVPFSEDDLWNGYPEETNAPYGLAKKMLLAQGQAYREQYGLNAVYLLPVNLYGPRDNFDPRSSHVIPALIKKFIDARNSGDDHVTLWGDGSPTREFIHVRDAARGIVMAAQSYDGELPINLGTGYEISIRDLSELLKDRCNFKGKIRWDTEKPNGQPRRRLDTSRAEALLKFKADIPLDTGLEETISWYESLQ